MPNVEIQLTQGQALDIVRRTCDETWLRGMLNQPDGTAIINAATAIAARVSDAVDEQTASMLISDAPTGAVGTCTLTATRSSTGTTIAIPSGFPFVTGTGIEMVTTSDVTVGSSQSTIVFSLRSLRQIDLVNTVDPAFDDALDVAGSIVAAISPDAPTIYGSGGEKVLSPSYSSLDYVSSTAIAGAQMDWLSPLGDERACRRQAGEDGEAYRARIRQIPDAISPIAVQEAVRGAQAQAGLPPCYVIEPALDQSSDLARAAIGLIYGDSPYADDAFCEDALGVDIGAKQPLRTCSMPSIREGRAYFREAILGSVVEPDDLIFYADRSFCDDPVDGYPDVLQHPVVTSSLAAVLEEMNAKRAAGVTCDLSIENATVVDIVNPPMVSQEQVFPCHIPDPNLRQPARGLVSYGSTPIIAGYTQISGVSTFQAPTAYALTLSSAGGGTTFAQDGDVFLSAIPGTITPSKWFGLWEVLDCGIHSPDGSPWPGSGPAITTRPTVRRTTDANTPAGLCHGMVVQITGGAGVEHNGDYFTLSTADPIVVDTTEINFTLLSSYTPVTSKEEILSTNQLASEGAPTTLMVADSPAWSTYEPNGLQIGPTFTSKPIGHTSIPAGPFGASLLLRNSVSATTFAEVRWWIKHVDDTTDAPFLSLWSSPIVDTYDSVYDFQTNFAGLTILATDRVECGVFAHGANDPHTGVVLYWTFQDSARTSRFTVTWQGNETYGGPFSNASLWHIEPPTNVVWMFREGWVACLSNGPIDPSTDSYGILIHLKGGVTIRAGLTSALDGLVLRTYTLAQLGYYNQEIIGIDGVLTGADKSFQLIGHFAFTAIDLSEVPEPVPTPEIGPLSLDFGGDLSAARSTPWVAVNSWSCRVSLGIGWPAGIIGAIGCELSGHGLTGTAGAPLPLTGLTQPAGTAATALVAGIRPKGASFIRFTWTPGVGNSGTGKSFTDESGVNGRLPTLGQP